MIKFDANGEYTPTLDENPVTPDGSHPGDWKGHFVVVINDKVFSKDSSDYIQFHREVLRRSKLSVWSGFTTTLGCFKHTFNPTVFDTYDRAYAALEAYANEVAQKWELIEDAEIESFDPLKFKRKRYAIGVDVDPMFEIVDAFEYRTRRHNDVRGIVRNTQAKVETANTHITRESLDDPKNAKVAQECEDSVRESQWKSEFSGKGHTTGDNKKTSKSFFMFMAKDRNSGRYLHIPTEGKIGEATLTELKDATYFKNYDKMIDVMNAIEGSYWNREFQSWHLTVSTATVIQGKIVKISS